MTWFDDFVNVFGGAGQSTVSLAPFVIYIVMAIAVIIGGYIVMREFQKRMHYKSKGTALEPIRITWEDKYAGIEGYLSKVDLLTDESFEALALQEEVKVNTNILKQLKSEGLLNVYFLNITDEQDVEDELNETYIVSPYPLEDLGWLDQKGRRYAYSLWNRIRRRNLFFFRTSNKWTITNADGDKEDWWLVSPKVKGETKNFIGFKGDNTFEPLQHSFETIVLEGGKKLVSELSYSTFLAKALAQNQEYKQQAEMFKRLHDEKIAELQRSHIKEQRWKMSATRRPYIVLTKEQFEKNTGINAIWMAVSGFVTAITGFMLPDFIPQIKEDSATMLGWVVGIVIVMLLYKIMTDQQKKKLEQDEESVEL